MSMISRIEEILKTTTLLRELKHWLLLDYIISNLTLLFQNFRTPDLFLSQQPGSMNE